MVVFSNTNVVIIIFGEKKIKLVVAKCGASDPIFRSQQMAFIWRVMVVDYL